MKTLKIILFTFFIAVIGAYVFTPDKLAKRFQKNSVKAVATELDVNPKVANFLVNTKVGRKIVYVFAKKKASKEIEKAMMPSKTKQD